MNGESRFQSSSIQGQLDHKGQLYTHILVSLCYTVLVAGVQHILLQLLIEGDIITYYPKLLKLISRPENAIRSAVRNNQPETS